LILVEPQSEKLPIYEEQILTYHLLDVKVRVEAATQLRDNLEHYVTGPIYPAFLKKLVPIFLNCLKGPTVFISTSPEQVRKLHSYGLTATNLICRNFEIAFSRFFIDCPPLPPSPSNHMPRKW
jgi:hypothetical protein